MKQKLHITYIISLLTMGFNASSQDFHFSNFNENPALVNPALTGVSSVFRTSAAYRDQWRSVTVPYKTYGVSVESRFKASNWKQVDDNRSMTFAKRSTSNLSGGLSVYSDKAGDGNMGTTQINLSLASLVQLNARSNLSVGIQGSMVQRSVDFSKLIFSNQYNGTGYDASLTNGEKVNKQSFIYPDVAAGICWNYATQDKMIASNEQKKASVGVSVYHANRPRQNFLAEGNDRLHLKLVFHGDFLIGIPHKNIAIAPSYLFQFQGASKELIVGSKIKYYIKEDSKYTGIIQRTSVDFGAYYRVGDAVILSFLLDKRQKMAIGFSYDLNISGLTKASKLSGGPEIILRFNTSNPYLYQKRAKTPD